MRDDEDSGEWRREDDRFIAMFRFDIGDTVRWAAAAQVRFQIVYRQWIQHEYQDPFVYYRLRRRPTESPLTPWSSEEDRGRCENPLTPWIAEEDLTPWEIDPWRRLILGA